MLGGGLLTLLLDGRAGPLGVRHLKLGERIPYRLHLLGAASLRLEQGKKRADGLDCHSRLLGIGSVFARLGKPEPLAAEVDERDDGLDENVAHRDSLQLLLEARAQLLLVRRWMLVTVMIVLVLVLVLVLVVLAVHGATSCRSPAGAATPA